VRALASLFFVVELNPQTRLSRKPAFCLLLSNWTLNSSNSLNSLNTYYANAFEEF